MTMTNETYCFSAQQSPPEVCAIMRAISRQYRADAENLRHAWQDCRAGAIWDLFARDLDKAAERAELAWGRT